MMVRKKLGILLLVTSCTFVHQATGSRVKQNNLVAIYSLYLTAVESLGIIPETATSNYSIVSGAYNMAVNSWAFKEWDRCTPWNFNPYLKMIYGEQMKDYFSIAVSNKKEEIFFITGLGKGKIQIWDNHENWQSREQKPLKEFKEHQDDVRSVAITQDNKLIVSGSKDKTIKIWNREGVCLNTLTGHEETVRAVAITPDDQHIISASEDSTVGIWNFRERLKELRGHTEAVNAIALSPDGKTIFSGSTDTTIKMWTLLDGICRNTFKGHTGSIRALKMTSNGKNIVSGSIDATLKIWNLKGECLHSFLHNRGSDKLSIRALAITPDDKYFVSGTDFIFVWRNPEHPDHKECLEGDSTIKSLGEVSEREDLGEKPTLHIVVRQQQYE